MALGFAVGTRGADHNRSGAYEVDFSEDIDRLDPGAAAILPAVRIEDEAVLMENAKSRGIENPEALLEDYNRMVDRWAELLADVDHTDTDALAALAKSEIYDKLDRANYGMN